MGCDIHTMAEVYVTPSKWDQESRTWIDLEPRWKAVKRDVFPYAYFREDETIDPFSRYGNFPYTSVPYQGRDYWLFSILADVRNTRTYTNMFDSSMVYAERDPLRPIAQPRGVPEDASKGWRKYVEDWGSDLHSTSYFTLTELEQAVADGLFAQTFTCRGYVTKSQLLALENEGVTPQSWASYSSDGISRAAWDALTAEEKEAFTGTIAAEWTETTEKSFDFFLNKTLPALRRLAPLVGEYTHNDRWAGFPDPRTPDTDKVRLVFGFDN